MTFGLRKLDECLLMEKKELCLKQWKRSRFSNVTKANEKKESETRRGERSVRYPYGVER